MRVDGSPRRRYPKAVPLMLMASCSEPLEAIDPFVEMGASVPDPCQADMLCRLNSDCRFVTLVTGQMSDDPLRWRGP